MKITNKENDVSQDLEYGKETSQHWAEGSLTKLNTITLLCVFTLQILFYSQSVKTSA